MEPIPPRPVTELTGFEAGERLRLTAWLSRTSCTCVGDDASEVACLHWNAGQRVMNIVARTRARTARQKASSCGRDSSCMASLAAWESRQDSVRMTFIRSRLLFFLDSHPGFPFGLCLRNLRVIVRCISRISLYRSFGIRHDRLAIRGMVEVGFSLVARVAWV